MKKLLLLTAILLQVSFGQYRILSPLYLKKSNADTITARFLVNAITQARNYSVRNASGILLIDSDSSYLASKVFTAGVYTPMARTLTIAANAPLSSSAGAQSLNANRTWTLSMTSPLGSSWDTTRIPYLGKSNAYDPGTTQTMPKIKSDTLESQSSSKTKLIHNVNSFRWGRDTVVTSDSSIVFDFTDGRKDSVMAKGWFAVKNANMLFHMHDERPYSGDTNGISYAGMLLKRSPTPDSTGYFLQLQRNGVQPTENVDFMLTRFMGLTDTGYIIDNVGGYIEFLSHISKDNSLILQFDKGNRLGDAATWGSTYIQNGDLVIGPYTAGGADSSGRLKITSNGVDPNNSAAAWFWAQSFVGATISSLGFQIRNGVTGSQQAVLNTDISVGRPRVTIGATSGTGAGRLYLDSLYVGTTLALDALRNGIFNNVAVNGGTLNSTTNLTITAGGGTLNLGQVTSTTIHAPSGAVVGQLRMNPNAALGSSAQFAIGNKTTAGANTNTWRVQALSGSWRDAIIVDSTATTRIDTLKTANLKPISTGGAAIVGSAVLVLGTVTVSTTAAKANSIIMLTRKTSGGTIGTAITYTITAGTSFTINSDNVLDTSTFSWLILTPY